MSLYYTTFEAAQLLGVSLPTVVNWIKARRIKAHRTPGGHRRIAREDLAGFMLRQGIPLPPELSDAVPARRKVLVIADGGPQREGTTRQLAQAGFAVEQVSPGFAAGAAAARFGPEAVVLHAASQDGGDTLRGLKGDRELGAVPVVALGPEAWAEGLRAAGARHLSVPPGPGALGEAVNAALGAGAKKAESGRKPKGRRPGA
jgi:excisionase family DNA binding protein